GFHSLYKYLYTHNCIHNKVFGNYIIVKKGFSDQNTFIYSKHYFIILKIMNSTFTSIITFCIMITIINYQLYELNAVYLPFNYRWSYLSYLPNDNDDTIQQHRLLSPITSSLTNRMHKRGPELIIPFISGETPAKKLEYD
ncbi:hypothetical protein MN116_007626, partial [Schistosoma mekongi]